MSQSIYQKLVKDIMIIGGTNVLLMLSGLFLLPVLTKVQGANNYGLYIQFNITITLLLNITTLGVYYAILRFLGGEKDMGRVRDDIWSIFVILLGVGVAASLVLYAFSGQIADLLFDHHRLIVVAIALLAPVETLNYILPTVFRIFGETVKYSIYAIVKTYAELVGIIALVLAGWDITGVIFFIVGFRFVLFAILMLMTVRTVGFSLPTFASFRKYRDFSLPQLPGSIIYWITNSSDRYMIDLNFGPRYVAYYSPGYTIGQLFQIVQTSIEFVLDPVIGRYYDEKNRTLVIEIIRYAVKYYLILGIPALCGLTILSKPLLLLITTPEIAEQGYIITPLIGLATIVNGFATISFCRTTFLLKRMNVNLMIGTMNAIVNVSFNIMLIPVLGIEGAAISFVITNLAYMVAVYAFSRKYFPLQIDWIAIAKTVIASLIMTLVIVNILFSGLFGIIVTILVGMIVYFIAQLLLRTVDRHEIAFIKNLLKQR